MDVSDLVHYNDGVRSLYYGVLAVLPWKELVESKGLSFDPMRDVFMHQTLVEDRWINYTLVGRFSEWTDLVFQDFTTIDLVKAYMIHVHEKTESFLKTRKSEDYTRAVANPWIQGAVISPETGLTHMVLECLVHFGELSAALWQVGKEAPYLAFLRYELSKTQKD